MSTISNVTISALLALLAGLGIGGNGTSQLAAISGSGSGLVNYYTFDESSVTTASDSSGNSNTGTVVGSPSWITGKINGALSFDGSSRVNINVPTLNSVSFSAWINPQSNESLGQIISAHGSTDYLRMWGSNGVEFVGGCSVSSVDKTKVGLTPNSWNHVAVAWNGICGTGSIVSITLNGSPSTFSDSGSGTRLVNSGSSFVGSYNGNNNFRGSLDDIRIYNRELSSSEIQELYTYTSNVVSVPVTPTPINATCGSSNNVCSVGTFSDQADSSSQYLWQCVGSNGGSTASCSEAIPSQPTNTSSPTVSSGNTVMATSCSQADVQSAINSVSVGGTVNVPAGTCTWITTSSYTPTISITKAITLAGAGIDQTIIRDGTGTNSSENPIDIGSGVRVTGFTFTDPRIVTDYKSFLQTSGTGWRVDNIKFNPGRYVRGMTAAGVGLVDHNTFINTSQGIEINGPGDSSWSSAQTLGTSNAIYIEDNTFNYSVPNDGAYDAYHGARYVFRYNTVNGTNIGHHGFDSGGFRSPFSFEIYNNTFNNPGSHIFTAMVFRGGSGVIFNNTVSGTGGSYDSFVILRNYRSDDSYVSSQGNSFDVCNGNSSYDGNTPGGQGYPCRDQIGRSTNQTLSPVYLWNNTYKGSSPVPQIAGYAWDSVRAIQYHILANRDFYNNTVKTGYTSYTYPHPSVSGSVVVPPAQVVTPPSTTPSNVSPSSSSNTTSSNTSTIGGTTNTTSTPSSGGGGGSSNTRPTTTGTTISSTNNSQLAQLVELFVSLGIIKPDKVSAARAFIASSQTTNNSQLTIGKFTLPLDIGARNTEVTALQTYLISQNLLFTKATGYYGPATAKAVGLFQQKYDISTLGSPSYGFVGPKTRAKLNELYR